MVCQAYVTRSGCPVHQGGGDVLLGLLGPSILAMAVQVFERRALLFQNAPKVGPPPPIHPLTHQGPAPTSPPSLPPSYGPDHLTACGLSSPSRMVHVC